MKQILVLGSGFVAKPAVDYLLKNDNYHVTVISLFQNELDAISKGYSKEKITTVQMDIMNKVDELKQYIPKSNIVISLLPTTLHPTVAKLCIQNKIHFITASYISPEMRALDAEAKAAGISFLNELGLDPGIDHMSSMKIIDAAKSHNAKITSFISWCGALPSVEDIDNPFGYKFSWSPRGVLLSASLDAKFLWGSHEENVPANIKFAVMQPVTVKYGEKDLFFEGVANRDSFPYIQEYSLKKEDLTTMYRGTLRWEGFSVMVRALSAIGLFSTEKDERLAVANLSWRTYLCQLLDCQKVDCCADSELEKMLEDRIHKAFIKQQEDIKAKHFHFPIIERDAAKDAKYATDGIKWLGMLNKGELLTNRGNVPLDALCATLEKKLSYSAGQVDLVVLQHEFTVEYPDGKKEKEFSKLICFGHKGGSSATSLTVGIPVGIAASLVVDGVIKKTGVFGPVTPEIYLPILDQLQKEGIEMVETKQSLN